MNFATGYLGDIYFESFTGEQLSKEAVLFLHGYPADGGNKNRDLAEAVSHQIGKDTYLLHYPGLGFSKGKFNFSESLIATQKFYSFIKSKGYSRVHIVGHSWGGYLALNLLKDVDSSISIVLLSPFINLPEGEALEALIGYIYEDTKAFLIHTSPESVIQDLLAIRTGNTLEDFVVRINSTSNRIRVVQALNDDETPVEHARYLYSKTRNRIGYIELNTDHSFSTGRDKVIEQILIGLQESL